MFAVAKAPGFRSPVSVSQSLAVATAMLYSLFLVPSLFLLVMPVPSHAWSRPLWYQVGLDLYPWGCDPNDLDNCRSSLGYSGYWMALRKSHLYPVAGVTITTTMMLVISRVLLHRRRSQVTKGQVSTALLCPLLSLLVPVPSVKPSFCQPGLQPCGPPG